MHQPETPAHEPDPSVAGAALNRSRQPAAESEVGFRLPPGKDSAISIKGLAAAEMAREKPGRPSVIPLP